MKQDKTITESIIEKIIEDKKLKIDEYLDKLKNSEEEANKTKEILERKNQEILQPLLETVKERTINLQDAKESYIDIVYKQLEAFKKGETSLSPKKLLEEYSYIKNSDYKLFEGFDEKALCLFEYFLKTEDVISAATFLKSRCGNESDTEFDKQRERYLEHMAKYPEPIQKPKADYIMRYGIYKDDILKLLRVCGQIDYKTKPEDYDSIFYSEQTKELLARASIGEFGKLCRHIYYDMPYGFGECDSDRRILMEAHDRGFETEQEATQLIEEKSL